MRIFFPNNQNGMVMVLAMFMLSLLSMIGVASMMTTTTDVEIATGERQYVETFYRTQAAHSLAGEVLILAQYDRGFLDAETLDADGDHAGIESISDYTFAFRLIDTEIIQEPWDRVIKLDAQGNQIFTWKVDEQEVDELPCPQDMTASECQALDTKIGTEDLDLWTDIRIIRIQKEQEITLADIDIDKIGSSYNHGGGAEFGGADLGVGSSSTNTIYNIDARSRLSAGLLNKSPSRQALGFRIMN